MDAQTPSKVTRLLHHLQAGDASAVDRLFRAVYQGLRDLAEQFFRREPPGQTIQPTALVHEAYIKLIDQKCVDWQGQAHFLAVAAQAMRRILLDRARHRGAAKRGGGWKRVTLNDKLIPGFQADDDLLALDEALVRLAQLDPRQAQMVELAVLRRPERRRDGQSLGNLETVRGAGVDHGAGLAAAGTSSGPQQRRHGMTPERHEQVKRIFLAACEVEPGQVAALLDQACAGDPELRREVESLLLHHFSETIIQTPTENGSGKAERFPPGTVLAGRYRILAPLGRGGMGDVYRADDLKLDQPVALKFLSSLPFGTDSAWLRRYENEVRLARKVTHPNVLRVYDIVETQGEVFITMEYVDGEDLASLLRRIGRLTGDKAIEIARQLCAGLGAAHDQGVLHRDLKPANIMIDGRGQVRIADFGIAALAAQDEPSGPVPGTPAYMAPELFEGGRPSVRSDLYALGMVLYEAATGKEPFEGKPPTDARPGGRARASIRPAYPTLTRHWKP